MDPGAAPAATQVGAARALRTSAVCGLLLLTVALVFGKTVRYGFVNFDDGAFVQDNPIVVRGLTAEGLASTFSPGAGPLPYPLTLISYMLDTEIYGRAPWGYHLTNVLLHAATTIVLFLLLGRMTGDLGASALVALLFAVHPLQVEAVAWISERKGVLNGLFFVSTIAAYVAYARRPTIARYLAVAGLFTLSLLAKPQLVTLPFSLMLLDYWPLGRWRAALSGPRQALTGDPRAIYDPPSVLVVEKVPLLVLAVAGCVGSVLSQAGNISSLQSAPLSARIANALVSYAAYLGQYFLPVRLAAFYPFSEHLAAWQVGAAVFVLAAVSTAALMARRKQPALLVGWLWYLGTLVPMIGLVQIGRHARADRYTYMPQIGLGIAVVWGARWAVERLWGDPRLRRRLYRIAGALWVGGLTACAWQQASYWHDSVRLWTHALACTSNNGLAHNNLGLALANRGDLDLAIMHYRDALEIEPDNAQAHNNLGLALAARGQVDEAVVEFQEALAVNSKYLQAYCNLGDALAERGEVEKAMGEYRKALAIKSDYVRANYLLGKALAGIGQPEEAMAHYQEVLKIAPTSLPRTSTWGLSWRAAGSGTRPSSITARCWRSNRTTPRPTMTSGPRWWSAGGRTRPSGIFGRPWKSSPTTSRHATTWVFCLPAGGRSRRLPRSFKGPWTWPRARRTGPWPRPFGRESGPTGRLRLPARDCRGRRVWSSATKTHQFPAFCGGSSLHSTAPYAFPDSL